MTRDDFIGQFMDYRESELMDHAGTPESADSRVLVSLYDSSWSVANRAFALAWPLLKHERTIWSSREEDYRSRVSSRNCDFTATPMTVDLDRTQNRVFPICEKVAKQGRCANEKHDTTTCALATDVLKVQGQEKAMTKLAMMQRMFGRLFLLMLGAFLLALALVLIVELGGWRPRPIGLRIVMGFGIAVAGIAGPMLLITGFGYVKARRSTLKSGDF